jgi:hypothetical protein
MALLHADGFDATTTADLTYDYDVYHATVGAYGRFGSPGLRCAAGSIARVIPVGSEFVSGVAAYLDADALSGSVVLMSITDPVGGVTHLSVGVNADKSFSVWRCSGGGGPGLYSGTVLATSAVNKATLRAWMTIAWKGVVHASAGSVALVVNGETLCTLTGLDTHNVTTTLSKVFLGAGGSTAVQFDDWWIGDQSGTRLNDFLGDRVVESQVAQAGNGHYTEWAPSTGSDHGALVDDAASDGDTTHNAADTIGRRDTYTFPATSRVDSVDAVRVTAILRKEGAGTRAVAGLTRVGGTTDTIDGTDQYLSTGYAGYVIADLPVNPVTTDPWLVADVDAIEVGPQVTA